MAFFKVKYFMTFLFRFFLTNLFPFLGDVY